jgi:membrane fusion protein (multidrug efflux system)
MSEKTMQSDASQAPTSREANDKPPQNGGRGGAPRKSIAGVVVAVAALVGGFLYFASRGRESTDDAFVEGHVIAISPHVSGHVAKVNATDNQWVKKGDVLVELDPRDFEAELHAARAELTAARAGGAIGGLGVTVATINSTANLDDADANVASAQAMVATAQAQYSASGSLGAQARSQVASATAALGQARAAAASSEAEHRRDAEDLDRYRQLAKAGAISRQLLDHAVATEGMSASKQQEDRKKIQTQQAMVEQARAALRAAEDAVKEAQAQVTARQAQFDQARAKRGGAQTGPQLVQQSRRQLEAAHANVDRAQAAIEQAELTLSYATIVAPSDGYVTQKSVEPGAYVQVGQPMLAIVPPDAWVTANFKETQLTRMRPGQPVKIRADAYPGVVFRGHVDSIQRGAGARFSLLPPENATGNYVKVIQRVPVKILFDADDSLRDYALAPGMSVTPVVDVSKPGGASTARASGVLGDPGAPGATTASAESARR